MITLPAKKLTEMVERIEEIASTARNGQARADLIRRLAGLGSWIGGLVPQMRPFNQMLWAALRTAIEGHIYQQQVKVALEWILAFASSRQGDFTRIIYVEWCEVVTLTLEVDASPVGGGFVAWWAGQQIGGRRSLIGTGSAIGPVWMRSAREARLDQQLPRRCGRHTPL